MAVYTTDASTLHVRSWRHFGLTFIAFAIFFGGYAIVELARYPLAAIPAAAIYVSIMLLFALYLAPGVLAPREWCARWMRGPGTIWIGAGIFVVPYLIYAAGTGDFRTRSFIRLFALAALPFGLFAFAPVRDRSQLNWQDALVLLWLFVPAMSGQIGGIWDVPVNLDFMTRVFLVAVGAWSFLIVRGLKESGYEFRFSGIVLKDAMISLGAFTAIGMPVGFALRFIGWNPQWRGVSVFARDYVTIFLFVAIVEELFFRGLLQNLLERSFGSRHLAQAASSVLFGLSHVRHAPAPNWRYVILATIAGWFYGWAYRKHRSLMASATTHAFVDTLWRTWFTLPRI
jgi:membrane protease YdiL (CAAX protease family)